MHHHWRDMRGSWLDLTFEAAMKYLFCLSSVASLIVSAAFFLGGSSSGFIISWLCFMASLVLLWVFEIREKKERKEQQEKSDRICWESYQDLFGGKDKGGGL